MGKSILKKVLCLSLSVVMVASITGCKKSTDTTGNNSGSNQGVTQENNQGATDQNTSSDGSAKLSDKELTVTILMSDNTNQPIINFAPAQQAIFDKTNIKLDYQVVPSSSYAEKKSVLLATNNFPEFAFVTSNDLVQYGATGVFEPLMKYVNEETMPNFYKFWKQYPEMENYLIDGELYAFPVLQRDETAAGVGPIIRNDLLEKHNIATPQTFDELLDALIKLKEIYPDSIPWTGRKGTSQLLKTTAYMLGSGYNSNGLYYDYDVNGGSYVFGPATKEFKEVLSYFNKAYEAGVLDPDFATSTAEQLESKMTSGKSFLFIDNSGFSLNYTQALREILADESATLQLMPIPENSFGQKRAISYETVLPGRFYALNTNAANKETLIKFIDWMYSTEGSDISNYGKEGYSFTYNDKGEPEFIKDYVMKFKGESPSTYYAIYSDLGITKLNFSLYACNSRTTFEIQKLAGEWNEDYDKYWSIIEADKAYKAPHIDPALTTEESEQVADILIELNTMLEQEYNKYIMGIEPIDNWDAVIEKANKLGAKELEAIYNNAQNR